MNSSVQKRDAGWRFAKRFSNADGLTVTVKHRSEGKFRTATGEVIDYLYSIEIGRHSFADKNRLVSAIPVVSEKGHPIFVGDDIIDLVEQAEDWISDEMRQARNGENHVKSQDP